MLKDYIANNILKVTIMPLALVIYFILNNIYLLLNFIIVC
jgi:hypothetical protein